jgi:hypothetical protein
LPERGQKQAILPAGPGIHSNEKLLILVLYFPLLFEGVAEMVNAYLPAQFVLFLLPDLLITVSFCLEFFH